MFWIAEQRFERAQAEELVEDVDDERLALGQRERRRLVAALDDLEDDAANLRLRLLLSHLRQPLEVQPVEQIVVDPGLQVLITLLPRIRRGAGHRNNGIHDANAPCTNTSSRPRDCDVYDRRPVRRPNSPACRLLGGGSSFVSTRPRAKPVNAAASLLWLSSTTGRPAFNASSAIR